MICFKFNSPSRFFIIFFFILSGTHLAAKNQVPSKIDSLPVVQEKPTIDGHLKEPCWKNSITKNIPTPNEEETSLFLCRDQNNLLIAATCKLSQPLPKPNKSLKTNPEKGDYLTFLIDSNHDKNSYYCVTVFPDGRYRTSYREHHPPWHDESWFPEILVKTVVTEKSWSLEVSLPFSIFSKNKELNSVIAFNATRHHAATDQFHGLQGDFANPADAIGLRGIPPLVLLREQPETEIIKLTSNSAHPGTTGEVTLELDGFVLEGAPQTSGIIWDIAFDQKERRLYVLSAPGNRDWAQLRAFDSNGNYLQTLMPFNPSLDQSEVNDLCKKIHNENGKNLVVPKVFETFGQVSLSLYGECWNTPNRIIVDENSDLIMSNTHRGSLMRIKKNGALSPDGWTSFYHAGRNEPFENTLDTSGNQGDSYLGEAGHQRIHWYLYKLPAFLPHPENFFPAMQIHRGHLYLSRGTSYQTSWVPWIYKEHMEWQHDYFFNNMLELPKRMLFRPNNPNEAAWKLKMIDSVSFQHKQTFKMQVPPQPKPKKIIRKWPPMPLADKIEYGGIHVDDNNLILTDTENDQLLVFDASGSVAAKVTHYQKGKDLVKFKNPTSIKMSSDGSLYLLLKQKDFGNTRIIKLSGWNNPKLLASTTVLSPWVHEIALDDHENNPRLWVANASGPGTLMSLSAEDLSKVKEWNHQDQLIRPIDGGNGMPMFNIDIHRGQLYIEDGRMSLQARRTRSYLAYNNQKASTIYKLDQDGHILNKWPSNSMKMDQPFSIDSTYGKDGNVYRMDGALVRRGNYGHGAVFRYDQNGKPLPFRSSGTHALAPLDTNDYLVDVDRHGQLYFLNKVKNTVSVYDSDGSLKNKELLKFHRYQKVGGIQVDKDGFLYVRMRWKNKPIEDSMLAIYKQHPLELCKFSPAGAQPGDEPLWRIPSEGLLGRNNFSTICACLRTWMQQTLDDEHGYLYSAGLHSIKVIDCDTGKVVGEFGSYGNRDCLGKGSANPSPELPFGIIMTMGIFKDRLYVVDALNQRIVKCKIRYQK